MEHRKSCPGQIRSFTFFRWNLLYLMPAFDSLKQTVRAHSNILGTLSDMLPLAVAMPLGLHVALRPQHPHIGQAAILLVKVQPIAHHKLVWTLHT